MDVNDVMTVSRDAMWVSLKLGGPMMNGFYATNTVNVPYADDASKNVRDWLAAYKKRYNEDAQLFCVYGYQVIDAFAQIAGKFRHTPDISMP